MHALNSSGDGHEAITSRSEAEDLIENQDTAEASEGSAEGLAEVESKRLEFPEAPDGPNPLEAPSSDESDSVDLEPEPPELSSKIVDSGGSGAGLLVAASGAVVIAALIGRNVLASGGSNNSENSLPVV